jgi:hypothetical protein
MQAFCSREFLESQLSRLTKKSYNPYYWWRRYETRKELDKKTPLYEKIKHGDYDPSDYLYQMEHEFYLMEDKLEGVKDPTKQHEIRKLFLERIRRLNEDYFKHEKEIFEKMYSDFRRTFNIDRQELIYIMENFEGSLLDLYQYIKKSKNDETV